MVPTTKPIADFHRRVLAMPDDAREGLPPFIRGGITLYWLTLCVITFNSLKMSLP